MALKQMLLPVCDGFELLHMAPEQKPLPACDGSEPSPITLEQMASSAAT